MSTLFEVAYLINMKIYRWLGKHNLLRFISEGTQHSFDFVSDFEERHKAFLSSWKKVS